MYEVYKVVKAPVGAIVKHLPEVAEEKLLIVKNILFITMILPAHLKECQDNYVVVQGK